MICSSAANYWKNKEVKMEEKEVYLEENKEESLDGSSIYSEIAIEQLIEDDELTAGEEGFMMGYLDA